MSRKLIVIKCPKCGREYLPVEIYLPKEFFGTPEFVKRDTEGHIVDYIGSSIDTHEKYCCDTCNTTFSVDAQVSFSTKIESEVDFSVDYSSRFQMKEF